MKFILNFKDFLLNEGASIINGTGKVKLSLKNDETNDKETLKTVRLYNDKPMAKSSGYKIYWSLDSKEYNFKQLDHIARPKATMDLLKDGEIENKEESLREIIKPIVSVLNKKLIGIDYIVVLGSRKALSSDIGEAFHSYYSKSTIITLNKIKYVDPYDMILWDIVSNIPAASFRVFSGTINSLVDKSKSDQSILNELENATRTHNFEKYKEIISRRYTVDGNAIVWKEDKLPFTISKSGSLKSSVLQYLKDKYDLQTTEFVEAIRRCVLGSSMLIVDDNVHTGDDLRRIFKYIDEVCESFKKEIERPVGVRDKIFAYTLYKISNLDIPTGQMTGQKEEQNMEDFKRKFMRNTEE